MRQSTVGCSFKAILSICYTIQGWFILYLVLALHSVVTFYLHSICSKAYSSIVGTAIIEDLIGGFLSGLTVCGSKSSASDCMACSVPNRFDDRASL